MQDYSIDQALNLLSRNPGLVLAYLAALPAGTLVLGLPLKKASPRGAAFFATVPTHIAVMQGVALLGVLAYSALFLRKSLLSLSIVVYYLPLLSSAGTLALSSKVASFDDQPGFGRLSGLCVMAALAFGIFFVLDRMHFFAGVMAIVPLATLGAVFVALNHAFGWAAKRVGGEKAPPPSGENA